MELASVVRIDIPQEYFGIDMNIFHRTTELFFGKEYTMSPINKVCIKSEVIQIALETFAEKLTDYSELYISSDSMRIKDAVDYMGDTIFSEIDKDLQGWLVFFDPYIFLNWEHKCEYMFIVNEDCKELKNYTKPYIEGIQMELIN